jgi:hypothetical protein
MRCGSAPSSIIVTAYPVGRGLSRRTLRAEAGRVGRVPRPEGELLREQRRELVRLDERWVPVAHVDRGDAGRPEGELIGQELLGRNAAERAVEEAVEPVRRRCEELLHLELAGHVEPIVSTT